jgi:hypothetical protein
MSDALNLAYNKDMNHVGLTEARENLKLMKRAFNELPDHPMAQTYHKLKGLTDKYDTYFQVRDLPPGSLDRVRLTEKLIYEVLHQPQEGNARFILNPQLRRKTAYDTLNSYVMGATALGGGNGTAKFFTLGMSDIIGKTALTALTQRMVNDISKNCYGVSEGTANIGSLMATLTGFHLAGSASTYLLNLIPGVGHVWGAVMSGATDAALAGTHHKILGTGLIESYEAIIKTRPGQPPNLPKALQNISNLIKNADFTNFEELPSKFEAGFLIMQLPDVIKSKQYFEERGQKKSLNDLSAFSKFQFTPETNIREDIFRQDLQNLGLGYLADELIDILMPSDYHDV